MEKKKKTTDIAARGFRVGTAIVCLLNTLDIINTFSNPFWERSSNIDGDHLVGRSCQKIAHETVEH